MHAKVRKEGHELVLSWRKNKILAETKVKAGKGGDLRNELEVVKSHLGLWAWNSVKLGLDS